MQSKNTIIGILGLVALVIGLLIWAVRMELSVHSIIPLVLAGLLIIAYAAQNTQYLISLFSGRAAMEGTNMAISIIIVLAIFVFLQIFLTKYSTIFDYTESKKYTLASQTTKIIEGLEEPIELLFITSEDPGGRTRELLELYSRYSDNLTYEIIDAQKNPDKVQQLAPVTIGAVYVKRGEQHEKVTPVNENNLTNALIKVVKGGNRKVYFTTGHGERSLDSDERSGISAISELLTDEGYQAESLKLFETGSVPEDAIAVVVAGPKSPFFEPEIEALRKFANQGGQVLYMIDPNGNSGLNEFLEKEFGIVFNGDYVIEDNPLMQMFGGSPIAPMAAEFGEHPIVNEMGSRTAVVFPIAQSIDTSPPSPEVDITPLVKSSARSYGEMDTESINAGVVERSDEEHMGPLNLAVAVTKPLEGDIEDATEETTIEELANTEEETESDAKEVEEKPEVRVVAFGDSDFINNENYQSSFNLFLNSVNWLAKQEDQISIRAKEDFGEPVMVSQMYANVIFYTALFVIPGVVAIFGAVVCLMKRVRGQ